jgi:hypothetical protein
VELPCSVEVQDGVEGTGMSENPMQNKSYHHQEIDKSDILLEC